MCSCSGPRGGFIGHPRSPGQGASDSGRDPSRVKLILVPEIAFDKMGVQGGFPFGGQITDRLGNLLDRWGYCLERRGLGIKLPLLANLSGCFYASKSWAS